MCVRACICACVRACVYVCVILIIIRLTHNKSVLLKIPSATKIFTCRTRRELHHSVADLQPIFVQKWELGLALSPGMTFVQIIDNLVNGPTVFSRSEICMRHYHANSEILQWGVAADLDQFLMTNLTDRRFQAVLYVTGRDDEYAHNQQNV